MRPRQDTTSHASLSLTGPPVGDGPGTVVPVRLDAATIAALTARAEAEGIQNRSDAIRAAIQAWTHVA